MKAIGLVLCTLGIALFAGAASASAGDTHTTTAWTHSTGSTYSLSALPLEDYGDYDHKGEHDSDHSGDHDRDHHGDHDRGHDHDHDHDRAPAPAPEPLTALLFGAAMLIGGGFLRRQHRKSQS